MSTSLLDYFCLPRWPGPLSGCCASVWGSLSVLSVKWWCLFLFIWTLLFINELFWTSAGCIWNLIKCDGFTSKRQLWKIGNCWATCENDSGLLWRPILISNGACPCPTDSICAVALWPLCSSSETSMLTGWKSPGHVWIPLTSRKPLWLLLLWVGSSGSVLNAGCRTSCTGLWSAEAGAAVGLRNLAHSCPLVISSRRLNEPRPNSKSLPQDKRGAYL